MRSVGRRGTVRGRPGSGLDRWLASWRFALRLGRREVRRHPGRSWLIAALVALPVVLISGFLTFFASQDISAEEGVERELGSAAASVWPSAGGVGWVRDDSGGAVQDGNEPVVPTPGYALDDPWDEGRVSAAVGAPVTRVGRSSLVMEGGPAGLGADDGRTAPMVLVLDGPPEGVTAPMAGLVSGRWPEAADEMVVTEAGVAQGLPRSGSGSFVLGQEEEPVTLRVVGVAEAAFSSTMEAGAVLPAAAAPPQTEWSWLVDRDEPVLVAEAQTWARHGLDVSSRAVLLDPPDTGLAEQDVKDTLFYAMLGLAVLVETALLAGPAFAVSAARQRHSLALAGAQGAARADVRRTVVAYGLVLAVLSAVVGAALGVALGLGATTFYARRYPMNHTTVDVPLPWLALLVLTSVASAGLAAWWPARGATRLDIMSVLRGQVVSGRVGRGWPVVGAVLALAGLGVLAWAATQVTAYLATPWVLTGAVLLGLGGMVLVPSLLALLARLSAGAPLPLRLAARDSVRQRSRAVPAVLAITAAVGVMAATLTVAESSGAKQQQDYQQRAPRGAMTLWLGDPEAGGSWAEADGVVREVAPDATTYPVEHIAGGPGIDTYSGASVTDAPLQAVLPAGCRAEEVTGTWPETGDQPRCSVQPYDSLSAVPLGGLESTGAVTAAMREVLEDGGVVLFDPAGGGVGRGAAVSAPATATPEGQVTITGPVQLTDVPVYRADADEMDALLITSPRPTGYVLPATAAELGWEGRQAMALAVQPGGFTEEQEEALVERFDRLGYGVYVERGWQPDPASRVVTLGAVAIFSLVALGAVVISTALTIAEGERDSATMAAVGGTRRTRRMVAAVHAVLIAAVGLVTGAVLGLVIGGALAWVTTKGTSYGNSYSDLDEAMGPGLVGVLAVPWLPLAAALLLIPLVAAAVAWFSVRTAPTLVRRLA